MIYQPDQSKGVGRLRTITLPFKLFMIHDLGIGTFPSAAFQNP